MCLAFLDYPGLIKEEQIEFRVLRALQLVTSKEIYDDSGIFNEKAKRIIGAVAIGRDQFWDPVVAFTEFSNVSTSVDD